MAKKPSTYQRIRTVGRAVWDESWFRSDGELTRFYKFVHFWVLVIKSFIRNRCPVRASALSYTTLLALVPILAVAMSVTTSILKKQGRAPIEQFINRLVASVIPASPEETNTVPANAVAATNLVLETNLSAGAEGISSNAINAGVALSISNAAASNQIAGMPAATNATPAMDIDDTRLSAAQKKVADQIYGFIENIQGEAIAGVSMLLLVYAAIRMFSQIEGTFNDIWGVTKGRSWPIRIVLYWAVISLVPILLVVVFGLTSGPYLKVTQNLVTAHPVMKSFVFPAATLLMLWVTFTLFYQFVPHTRVRFTAALVGGMVSGTVWHLNNVFGILFASRLVTNSKIYGGLALIPVIMIGLYFSWFILLFGAQVAYAFQNRALYLQDKIAENVNQRGREFVALRLMTCIGQRFQRGLPAPTIEEMSLELGIPSRLVQQVLHTMIAAHLVMEINGVEAAYTPARPLEYITAHHILMAMRATPGQELITRDEPVRAEVYGEFARIQDAERDAASAISMLTLVNRAEARLEIAPPPSPDEEFKLKPALIPPHTPPTPPRPWLEPEQHKAPPSEKPKPKMPEPEKPVAPVEQRPPPREFTAVAAAPEPTKTAPHVSAPVVEPASDEERDFPL